MIHFIHTKVKTQLIFTTLSHNHISPHIIIGTQILSLNLITRLNLKEKSLTLLIPNNSWYVLN